jgi:hypothetical protein
VFNPREVYHLAARDRRKMGRAVLLLKSKTAQNLFAPHYRSSAKKPKKLLCAPETLTSLHVALDFHGCLSFRSVLRPPWQGKNSES